MWNGWASRVNNAYYNRTKTAIFKNCFFGNLYLQKPTPPRAGSSLTVTKPWMGVEIEPDFQIRPLKAVEAAFAKKMKTLFQNLGSIFKSFFCKLLDKEKRCWDMAFFMQYNPLLALAEPFYSQLTSSLDMWCILTWNVKPSSQAMILRYCEAWL